jgi:hypothetical protein
MLQPLSYISATTTIIYQCYNHYHISMLQPLSYINVTATIIYQCYNHYHISMLQPLSYINAAATIIYQCYNHCHISMLQPLSYMYHLLVHCSFSFNDISAYCWYIIFNTILLCNVFINYCCNEKCTVLNILLTAELEQNVNTSMTNIPDISFID